MALRTKLIELACIRRLSSSRRINPKTAISVFSDLSNLSLHLSCKPISLLYLSKMPCLKPFLAAARIPFPSMVFGREQPEKRLVQRVWRFHYLPIISAIFAHDHYILHDSKSVDLLGPWVRIPPTPPHSAKRHMLLGSFLIPGSNLPALQGPGSGAWRPPCWSWTAHPGGRRCWRSC